MLALRIQRVRGNLSSIEFDWKKPWTLRNDMLVEQHVRHPLQPVEDESKDPSDVGVINTVSAEFHDRNRVFVELLRFRLLLCAHAKVVALKLLNTIVSKLLSSYPELIAASVIVTGAYLTAEPIYASGSARWSKPYRDKTTNQGVVALGILVLFAGVTSELLVWYPGSQAASIAQSLFGVIALLVVTATLLALTPIGELFARAWIRCTLEDKPSFESDAMETMKEPRETENPLSEAL